MIPLSFNTYTFLANDESMGAANVEITLSNLIYSFDWELPVGAEGIDTLKTHGVVTHKTNALRLVAKVYNHDWKS
ncbi:hypothetical protein Tco_0878878 [Tanacetum coccineum]|uniref:Uncharacterized protein n=1 Tax=Tanacetum coccineum TaxID=301880 RepID=A0ABQ5C2C8_9ASTR